MRSMFAVSNLIYAIVGFIIYNVFFKNLEIKGINGFWFFLPILVMFLVTVSTFRGYSSEEDSDDDETEDDESDYDSEEDEPEEQVVEEVEIKPVEGKITEREAEVIKDNVKEYEAPKKKKGMHVWE